MDSSVWIFLAVAGGAALCSPLGGVIAVIVPPSTMLLSIAVGMAGGILLGTLSFEMLPKAIAQSSLLVAVSGFALGFALVYLLDLFVNRWHMAGDKAEEKRATILFHRRHPPKGTKLTVLASATATEELIEGLAIGVSGALDPKVALVVGIAIAIDNISEAMSIGELAQAEKAGHPKQRTLFWTSTIGVSLFVSALAGWFVLRNLPEAVLAFLLAVGAGAMLYLSVTSLVPESEEHHFQQSAGLAIGVGFMTAMILSQLSG
jgi:zinc transporter, ZIP family